MKPTVEDVDAEAIGLMYHALLAINCVSAEILGQRAALATIKGISDEALKRMNGDHTEAVQRALGIL